MCCQCARPCSFSEQAQPVAASNKAGCPTPVHVSMHEALEARAALQVLECNS